MLKQTITKNKLITPQTIKQSFDNIKKAALIEGTQVNKQLKMFNTLVTLTKWKNNIFLGNFRLLIEINVIEDLIRLQICEPDDNPTTITGYQLNDAWNSIAYLIPHEDSLNIILKGFFDNFTVAKAITEIDEAVFKPVWKNINRLSLADSSIFLTDIDSQNNEASCDLKPNDVFYDQSSYDFNDFEQFDIDMWMFSNRSCCKNAFLRNIMLPINMIPAENVIQLLTSESGPIYDTPGLEFVTFNGVGKDVYYLDFDQYADKEQLIELVRQRHLISIFPELKCWKNATDKFKALILKDVKNLNLSVLSKCFDGKYLFNLDTNGALSNNDLNYLVWIVFEDVASTIEQGDYSDEFKTEFIQAIWAFIEQYFAKPKFGSLAEMFVAKKEKMKFFKQFSILSKSIILKLADLDYECDEDDYDDSPARRVIYALSSKVKGNSTIAPHWSSRYLLDNQKVKEQLESANETDMTVKFDKDEVDEMMNVINEYLPTTENINRLSIKCIRLDDDLFFVNFLDGNRILD